MGHRSTSQLLRHPEAKVVALKLRADGGVASYVGVARWDSYVQTTKEGKATKMWASMPDVMLAKCAEGLALRKAYPAELSGLYTADEMGLAENVAPPTGATPAPVPRAVAGGPFDERVADPTTGEIKAKPAPRTGRRPPPGQPPPADDLFEVTEAEIVTLATDEQRADVASALELLTGDQVGVVKAAWKSAGIPVLAHVERFTTEHADQALGLIADATRGTI